MIINLLQRKRVETILFSVSDGCTLAKELENLNINYYRYVHVNHSNGNFYYILKRTLKHVSLFSNYGK